MTIDGGEPGLEVPITSVGPPRRERRRATIAAVALVVIVGGAIALAMSNRVDEPVALRPTPTGSARIADPTPGVTASPGQPQELAPVDNVLLLGAPTAALVVRSGADAKVLGWTPGEPDVSLVRTFPNAFDVATQDSQYAMLSPDGLYLAAFTSRPSSTIGADRIRIVSENGIQWERTGITADTGAAWWGGSARLAVIGGATTWVLADVDENGAITAREVEIEPAASLGALTGRQLAPIGFATDGQSVIVGFFDEAARTVQPAYRLAFADGSVEPLVVFPNAGPGGLTAETQEYGFVDPIQGRTFSFPFFGEASQPSRLTVLDPDGDLVFEVDSRYVVRAVWDDAGQLAILEGDHFDGPTPLRLLSVARDGTTTKLFETPLVARGALLGVRDGYAGLALQVDDPRRTQLVLVAMGDGRASGIEVDGLGADGPNGAGWLP